MNVKDLRILLVLGMVILASVVPLNATLVVAGSDEEGNKKATELLFIWIGYACFISSVTAVFLN